MKSGTAIVNLLWVVVRSSAAGDNSLLQTGFLLERNFVG